MSNEESERITTSQDVISHLHDKIDEQQAEAMRLADECEESATHWVHEIDTRFKAAKMLRAQQARIAELEERLEIDCRHPYDGIAARDVTIKALDERIAELEKENSYLNDACAELEALLEAIGAGGVEPLRRPAAQGMEKDAARYRWLRNRMLGVDFDWCENGITALAFEMPDGCAYGGDCDQNIDAAIAAKAKQGE